MKIEIDTDLVQEAIINQIVGAVTVTLHDEVAKQRPPALFNCHGGGASQSVAPDAVRIDHLVVHCTVNIITESAA
jgi:hypothetical protein